jgi:hypothetical protein
MNALTNANLSNALDHSILDNACTYDIVGIRFVTDLNGALNGTLDLSLAKDGQAVVLRFNKAHELEIYAGFPYSYMGLEILDVTYLGWEHSRVRVQGFENAPGIRFWAQDVERLTFE